MLWFTLTAHWSMSSSSFCIKATDTRNSILHSEGTEQRGIAVGEIFFPKSYFQQKASKTSFLKLIDYVYLLGKQHNMSPLRMFNYDYEDTVIN